MTLDGPLISVIIPTFNRCQRLQRALAGLGEQRIESGAFETIVVSDGSTDGTDVYLERGATPVPVVSMRQPNTGPAAARNRGIAEACGDLIVFIDDDIVPAPDLLTAHLAAHENSDDRLVTIGPMLTPNDVTLTPWVEWEQRMLYKQYDAIRDGTIATSARQFYTGNAAIRRAQLAASGGFNEAFRRAEDVELAYRLADGGSAFAFVEGAIGFHYAERSFASWRSNAYDYGRNDVIFGRDQGRAWMMRLIAHQFESRHRLIRSLTRQIVPHAFAHRAFDRIMQGIVSPARRVGGEDVQMAVLSAVYNLAYYRGVHDEIGGAAEFKSMLEEVAP